MRSRYVFPTSSCPGVGAKFEKRALDEAESQDVLQVHEITGLSHSVTFRSGDERAGDESDTSRISLQLGPGLGRRTTRPHVAKKAS